MSGAGGRWGACNRCSISTWGSRRCLILGKKPSATLGYVSAHGSGLNMYIQTQPAALSLHLPQGRVCRTEPPGRPQYQVTAEGSAMAEGTGLERLRSAFPSLLRCMGDEDQCRDGKKGLRRQSPPGERRVSPRGAPERSGEGRTGADAAPAPQHTESNAEMSLKNTRAMQRVVTSFF